MPLTSDQRHNALLHAIKIAEGAVANAGIPAFNGPEKVALLIETVTIKIQELMEKAESGN